MITFPPLPLPDTALVFVDFVLFTYVKQDDAAYKKDESNASVGPAGYYADGLTPPAKNIVRRRFLKARPDQGRFDRGEVGARVLPSETKYHKTSVIAQWCGRFSESQIFSRETDTPDRGNGDIVYAQKREPVNIYSSM